MASFLRDLVAAEGKAILSALILGIRNILIQQFIGGEKLKENSEVTKTSHSPAVYLTFRPVLVLP